MILIYLFSALQVYSSIQPNASTVKPNRPKRDMGPLLPFEELVDEDVYVDESFKQEDGDKGDANDKCNLPNPCDLLHVTNRKKAPSCKKSLSMVCHIIWLINISFSSILSSFYANIFHANIAGGQQISRIAGRI